MPDSETRSANHLIHETSPYLLQHAYNPVEWHPWGEEALSLSKRLDRPILMSVGYSACHWCHVMERESFEDDGIAAIMNRLFVNIKVDREERPDLDAIYMNYVQMTTGSGGWPLTVFLTPDQIPFYGGTYFPPNDRYGRPGFPRVLESVAAAYRDRRDELDRVSPEVVQRLRQAASFDVPPGDLHIGLLDQAQTNSASQFDHRHGGFGAAPKFPAAMLLSFLLRHWRRTGSEQSLEMVQHSLAEMAGGGIFDQLGGGFHRYSVDDRWLVPHFEKMLYDNALLSRTYLEAYQATGRQSFRDVVEETLDWVAREMRDPAGGFYSALDADSEGEEGKFYVWSADEIEAILDKPSASLFAEFYDVTPHGNFEGRNILHRQFDPVTFAEMKSRPLEEVDKSLRESRSKLLQRRQTRVWPGRDDKVLTAWNGMMLSAFAEAAFALDRPDYLLTAIENAKFLKERLWVEGRLRRTWKKGVAKLNAYLEDYAAVVEGYLCLYQAAGDIVWLDAAEELIQLQFVLFGDEDKGDFYFTASDHERLLVRQKEHLDNATPSGNSVTCANLLRLAAITGKQEYRARAEVMLSQMALALARHPSAFGNWLQALDFCLGPVTELVFAGTQEDRRRLLQPVRQAFLPNKVVIQSDDAASQTSKIPLLVGKSTDGGRAAVYVCENQVCRAPCYSVEEIRACLGL